MTKDELIEKFISLNEKTNVFLERVSKVLEEVNDQNRLHTRAIEVNTEATREMTKSFSRVWKIFFLTICALIVLALAEKIKSLDYLFKFF